MEKYLKKRKKDSILIFINNIVFNTPKLEFLKISNGATHQQLQYIFLLILGISFLTKSFITTV